MKLHIWTDRVSYLAIAHADSVSEARELLLKESDLGESGDGSCPERDKARRAILSETSAVYVGRVAEFSLSDSAQLREQEDHSDKLHQQIAAKDRRIAELEAALKYEHARFDAVWHFCSVEMGWEYFREEFFGDSTSAKNARQLMDYLKAHPLKAPEPTECLDAMLAQAKREALRGAIDWFEASRYVEWSTRAIAEELDRMAREVKP